MSQENILIVGLDGATWKILKPLIKSNKLPFLKSFTEQSICGDSIGTIPPLTPSVWTSFLTGVNPGKHGVFGFLNYRNQRNLYKSTDIKYPQITELLKKKSKTSYISFNNLDGLIAEAGVETQTISYTQLLESASKKVQQFKTLDEKRKFTFSFILFKEIDKLQHLYWDTPILEKFFSEFDHTLGDLINYYKKSRGNTANIIVLSDHGFHQAARVQFSIYPWLVKEGFLLNKPNILWQFIHNFNWVLKKVGIDLRKLKGGINFRDRIVGKIEKSVAKDIDLLATFEGIYVQSTENKRKLLEKLKNLTYKNTKVFKYVFENKQIYKGAYYDYGPDVVWLPNEKFTINISPLEKNIFSTHHTDIPGDHVSDRNGIYIINASKKIKNIKKKLQIYDLTALIYDILKIDKPLGLDGISPIADYSMLDKKIGEVEKSIKASFEKYKNNWAVAFTGRKDSLVMVHQLIQVAKKNKFKLPSVFFIDHGEHFPESLKFLHYINRLWKLNVLYIKKKKEGSQPLANLKIQTINEHIQKNNLQAVMSAIRRDESPARVHEQIFSKRENHYRIHPLINFTENDIWDYIKRFNLPYNPLYDQGYRSLEEKTTKRVYNYQKAERSGRDKQKEKVMENLRKLGYF